MGGDPANSNNNAAQTSAPLTQGVPGTIDVLELTSPKESPSAAKAKSSSEQADAAFVSCKTVEKLDLAEVFVPAVPSAQPIAEPRICTKDATASDKIGTAVPLRSSSSSSSHTTSTKENSTGENGTRAAAKVTWQWEHRTGFKDYDSGASRRIEEAYMHGEAYVRLKSGKNKTVPMEVFFADMLQYDPVTNNNRKVRRVSPNTVWARISGDWRRFFAEVMRSVETGMPRKVIFAEYEQARKELFQGGVKTVQCEKDLYSKTGCIQKLARSGYFFSCSILGVLLYTGWMGYEAEFNNSSTIVGSDWYFQVVEYMFGLFFLTEALIRFGAFKRKSDCWKDGWFVFDAALVSVQAIEIVASLILTGAGEALTFLRSAKLLRLLRLGRIVRMLKLFPEVLTLLKGIKQAMRSVCYVLAMLIFLLFVFAIIFKTQSIDDEELSSKFPHLSTCMYDLLLHGTLLDGPAKTFYDIEEHSPALAALFLGFIFLSSLTVLNMLIGILCDVVCNVSNNEKEEQYAMKLKQTIINLLECYDKNDDKMIGRDEFALLMQNPETRQILRRFDVDVATLLSLQESLFDPDPTQIEQGSPGATEKDDGKMKRRSTSKEKMAQGSKTLTFNEILDVILRLRGGKSATVTDVADLREFVRVRMDHMEEMHIEKQVQLDEMQEELSAVNLRLSAIINAMNIPDPAVEKMDPERHYERPGTSATMT
jgi:hypothetical protein